MFCMYEVQIILALVFSRAEFNHRLALNGHAEAKPVVQENG